MAKQLNVNLAFTADTSKARAEINSLQQSLNKLSTGNAKLDLGGQISNSLKQASVAAAELQVHLKKAVNPSTGTLNFANFNQSLKASNSSAVELGKVLLQSGTQGQQAFQQLALSIAKSETSLKRSNTVLNEFWTTLKNTARWQISSSVLHGFMGAIQGAYGYAKDLNASLNNIRIVTGQSADQMARFAEQANKTAKQLSTTTTKYTDAALIYYQQGLNDSQVKERTDITVKMANAAGVSAQVASDQLTAIWNNFDNGSQSLEHYANVLVKLGAETASSSDEISQGMEKFAAVANTVGLSYEYAAAALATVTATTRQSADTVGTAFKTLFGRLEGLQLGETLEDGTDLNKYSKALATVGVNIKDTSGEMKDMDTILDELGDKWKTLGKDQQIALAQTVGGMRQYTQLIALMDNWDFFEQNLASAKNSDGALQEQADIYAESWEAAANRVRAAQEAIFQDLLKDKGFIGLLNIFEDLLTGVDNFIDSLGGVLGVVSAIGALSTQVFSKQMAQGLRNTGNSIKMWFGGPDAVNAEREKTLIGLQNAHDQYYRDSNKVMGAAATISQQNFNSALKQQQQFTNAAPNLTGDQVELGQLMLDGVRASQQAEEEAYAKKEIAQENSANSKTNYLQEISDATENGLSKTFLEDVGALDNFKKVEGMGKLNADLSGVAEASGEAVDKVAKLQQYIADIRKNPDDNKQPGKFGPISQMFEEDLQGVEELLTGDNPQIDEAIKKFKAALKAEAYKATDNFADDVFGAEAGEQEQVKKAGKRYVNDAFELGEQGRKAEDATKNRQAKEEQWEAEFEEGGKLTPKGPDAATRIVAIANAFSSLGMAAANAKGIVDTWNNTELTFGEKLTSTLMTAGTTVVMLTNAMTALKEAEIGELVAKIPNIAATAKDAVAKVASSIATGGNTIEIIKNTVALNANTAARLKNIGTMAAYLAIAAGVAAAATAMGNSVDTSLNSDANNVSELTSGLSELETAYSEIASAHSDFINASSSYDTAINSLDNLIKGTDKYKETLLQANEAALEMIKNNPDLKYETDYDTGLIKINQDDKKQAEQDLLEQKITAQNEKIIAQQKLQIAKAELDKVEYLRKNDDELSGYNKTSGKEAAWLTGGLGAVGAIAGLTIAAATGGLALLPAAAIGALTGVGLGAGQAEVQKDNQINREARQKDALDNIAEAFEKTGKIETAFSSSEALEAMLSKSGLFNGEQIETILKDEDLINSLTDNASETANLMNTILSTNEQLSALNEKIGEDTYGKDIDKAISQNPDVKYSQADKDKAEELIGSQLQQRAAEIEASLEASGANNKNARKRQIKQWAEENGINSNDLEFSQDRRSATYLDENGKEQTIKWSQARSDLATRQAQKELDATDFQDLLQSAKDINDQQFADLLQNIGNETISKLFETDKFANLNNEDKTQLATYLGSVEGTEHFNILIQALSGMDTSQLEQFVNLIQTTDWPTTSAQEFTNKLVELGIISDTAATGLAKVIEFLQQLGLLGGKTEDEYVPKTDEQKQAEYNKIKGITDSITDQNRQISKDNYDQLPPELQKYFSGEDAGGNRYAEGDIDAFQEAAKQAALSPYQDEVNALAAERTQLSNVAYNAQGRLYDNYQDFSLKYAPYGTEQIGDWLSFLDYAKYNDITGELADIQTQYLAGQDLSEDQLGFLQEALNTEGYAELWNDIPQTVTDLGAGINEAVSAMATTFGDESELMSFLQQQVDEGNITEEERDSIYDEADEKVGREHAEELGLDYEDYQMQLENYESQFAESFTSDYGAQLQEAYGQYGDSEEMQMMSAESAEDLIPSQEEIAALAAEHLEKTHKTNEAIAEGKEKYKDLAKTLDKTVEGTSEWEDAMDEVREITADILGVDVKSLSKDFIKLAKDSGKLEKAMNGDKKAINDLRKAAAKTNLAKTLGKQLQASGKEVKGLDEALKKMDMASTLEEQEVAAGEALTAMADSLGLNAEDMTSQLDSFYNWLSTAEPGEPIPPDFSAFLSAIANAAAQAGMSVQQIQDLFSNFGGATLQVQTEEKTIPGEESTTTYDNVYSYQPWNVDTVRHVYMGQTKATIKKEDQKVTGLKVIGVAGDAPMVKDGGGGGGGGGGAKPPKPKKRIDPKVRYEGTQKQIDNLASKQEQTEKKKELSFGKEKIVQAEKEIELKQRQIKLQTKLMEETKEALELQKIDVADRLKKFTGVEIEFDVDGSVANLDEIEEAILNLENKIIDLENSGADEFTIAHWEEILDMAREGFDDLLDIIEDSLDAENAFFEAINELAELNLELIQIKVDLDISLADAELEYIDYLLEKLVDEGFEAAEAITVLGDKANNALGKIDTYRKGIAEILANRGLSADELMNMDADDLIGLGFTQAEIDALLEYRSAIIENMSTLNELRAEMTDKVAAAFGIFSEELTRQIELFEHYSGLLEHFGEIATLTGSRFAKSELRDLFSSIDNAAMANGQANIRAAKSNLDDLRSMYEAYMTSYAEAKKQAGLGENDTIFEYEETRKEMEDALKEAEETFYTAWEETLSKATDILERWVEDAGARFEEVLSPMYQSLDRLEEAYERMKEQDENYYDNYEQLYHLSQLTRDISNSIDDTDNIKGKQRLRDLMKEITDIQTRGVELSEYDVDILRKRYELEQARQALEDASDNASLVRLQRDQEGNWGYVYTADEDAVDEAEKEYENKLYELQKANDEYIKELQDRILELTTNCKEQLADIAADTALSPEEKERLSQEVTDFYNSQLEYLTSQMDGALANQNATLGLMLSVYDTTKDQLLDTWEETNLSLLGMYNNTGDMFAGLTGAMKGYVEDLWEGIQNFDNNLNNTNIAAGSKDAFGALADEISKIGGNTEEAEKAVESLGDTFVSEFETIMGEVTRFEEVWGTQIDAAIDKNEEFVSSLLEVISLLALVNTDDKEFTDAYNEYKTAQQKYLESLDETVSPSTIRYGLVETNDPEWEAAKKKFEEFMTQWMAKHSGGIMDNGQAYDTGGYTGEWGPEGRLAWLHQKEIVLNATDTENLLDAIAMVRTLELNVGTFTDKLSEIVPSMMTMEREAFQQEIYITAEFPDATSATEIQEAFENLINDAVQYAYSK